VSVRIQENLQGEEIRLIPYESDKDDKALKKETGRRFPFSDNEIEKWNLSTRVWRAACKMRETSKNDSLIKITAEALYVGAGTLGLMELPFGMISAFLISNPISRRIFWHLWSAGSWLWIRMVSYK